MNSNTYKVVIHYTWIIISALFYLGWFKAESLNEMEEVFNKLCKLVFSDRCSTSDCNKRAFESGYCGEHTDKTGRLNRCESIIIKGKRKGETCGCKCDSSMKCLKHTEHKSIGELDHDSLPDDIRWRQHSITNIEVESLKRLNNDLIDKLKTLTKERDLYLEKLNSMEYEKEASVIRSRSLGIDTPVGTKYSPAIENTRKFTPMNELSTKVINSKIDAALGCVDGSDIDEPYETPITSPMLSPPTNQPLLEDEGVILLNTKLSKGQKKKQQKREKKQQELDYKGFIRTYITRHYDNGVFSKVKGEDQSKVTEKMVEVVASVTQTIIDKVTKTMNIVGSSSTPTFIHSCIEIACSELDIRDVHPVHSQIMACTLNGMLRSGYRGLVVKGFTLIE